MKHLLIQTTALLGLVASHAGAWIETSNLPDLPQLHVVASHAGAWIETTHSMFISTPHLVASHAGAWIETILCSRFYPMLMSLPTRERGLKHGSLYTSNRTIQVASHAGAWIETNTESLRNNIGLSRFPRGSVD